MKTIIHLINSSPRFDFTITISSTGSALVEDSLKLIIDIQDLSPFNHSQLQVNVSKTNFHSTELSKYKRSLVYL